MRIEEYKVPQELVESIQTRQLELESIKDLLAFLYSTTQYEVDTKKLEHLEKEYKELSIEYNLLKEEVEEIFISEFNRARTSWNLDFNTNIVTVVEND